MRNAGLAALAGAWVCLGAPVAAQQVDLPEGIQQRLPRELQASVEVCWAGRMVPERMALEAADEGYPELTDAQIADVAPDAVGAPNVMGWSDGVGEDEVRLVTYETNLGGIPHIVCVISAVRPTPQATFGIMYEVFQAPRREDWRDGNRIYSWYWIQEGRYVMADYVVSDDLSEAKMRVQTQALQ